MAASRTGPSSLVRASERKRRELDETLARIRRLREKGMEAFDELWEEVGSLLEGEVPLWRVRFKSVGELVAKELPGESVRSVQRNVLVARSFSPEEESKHTLALLEEAALYAKEVAGAAEVPRAIHLDRLFIRVRDGAHVVRKPVRDATVQQIRRARREHAGAGRRRAKESPALAVLRTVLQRFASLRGVSLRFVSGEIFFGSVPVDALADLGRALRAAKLPKPAPPTSKKRGR